MTYDLDMQHAGSSLPYVGQVQSSRNSRCVFVITGTGQRRISDISVKNKYVRARNTRTKMYAGRVAYCSLVNRVEYAPHALLLSLEKDGT